MSHYITFHLFIIIINWVPDVVEAEGREPVLIHGGSGPPPPVRLFVGTPEGRRDVPTVDPGHRHRRTLQGWFDDVGLNVLRCYKAGLMNVLRCYKAGLMNVLRWYKVSLMNVLRWYKVD